VARGRGDRRAVPGSRFRDLPLNERADAIRYETDWQWAAAKLQYDRLMSYSEVSAEVLLEDLARQQLHARADMDFLITAVRRLLRAAEHARDSGCDANGTLALPIRRFRSRWAHALKARDALEHFDEWERRRAEGPILPVRGGGDVVLLWPGGNVSAGQLFRSAEELFKAVSDLIEPLVSGEASESSQTIQGR